MRIFWLVVIPVVLLGAPLRAQEARWRPFSSRFQSDWATTQQPQEPTTPPRLGMPTPTTPPAPSGNSAPQTNQPAPLYSTPYSGYPAPALAVPPTGPSPLEAAPVPPAPAGPGGAPGCGCCDQGGGDHNCWARFKQWLCYRPIMGGCGKCGGCCSYNCFLPLYLYFLGECCEGNCHTLPPPCGPKPCLFSKFLPTGHRYFAMPTGMGCCPMQ